MVQIFSHTLGIKESDTGLAPPAMWDLAADKQTLQSEQPLQVMVLILQTIIIFLEHYFQKPDTFHEKTLV